MMSRAETLIRLLTRLGLTVSCAESCTGGWIAKKLTDVPGCSAVFPGGVVSYCDRVKRDLLSVPAEMLDKYTAVSPQVAQAMAIGVCRALHTDLGISTTGYAGPNDAQTGLVYIAVSVGGAHAVFEELHLIGNREEIRELAAERALALLLRMLDLPSESIEQA